MAGSGLFGRLAGLFRSAGSHGAKPVFTLPDEEAFDPSQFPYPLETVRGEDAFETWLRLREAGRGVPVVIGSNFQINRVLEALEYSDPIADTLAKAAGLTFPADLLALRERELAETDAYFAANPEPTIRPLDQDTLKALGLGGPGLKSDASETTHQDNDGYLKALREGPELGEWPHPEPLSSADPPALALATSFVPDRLAPAVHIALLPISDWTEAPAYLRFGGFNACPSPELQIAAFRSLRDRYGAELIGCGCDTVELRVSRRPGTREEAISLARELHAYCEDTIDQGFETVSR